MVWSQCPTLAARHQRALSAHNPGVLEAIDLGYTDKNPAYGLLKKILPPKNKRNLTESDPFNLQDRDTFLEAAWAKLPDPYPLIIEVMAMAGFRLGEVLAMSWENLDVRNLQYNINETTRQGRFGPPKSGKRLVDLDPPLVAKLETHIKKLRKESLTQASRRVISFLGSRSA